MRTSNYSSHVKIERVGGANGVIDSSAEYPAPSRGLFITITNSDVGTSAETNISITNNNSTTCTLTLPGVASTTTKMFGYIPVSSATITSITNTGGTNNFYINTLT